MINAQSQCLNYKTLSLELKTVNSS